jgi:hypothetical protein
LPTAPYRGPAEGRKQNQRQRRQKAEKLTNLALLHTGVLQKVEGRKQNQRQRRQKAENIDKPCPTPYRGPAEGTIRDRGDRKRRN